MVEIKNVLEWFRINPEYKIKCPVCKTKQPLATYWDYQNCSKCGSKIYDNRI